MLTAMSTPALLMALDNFVSIRGKVEAFYCDNGTNFVRASKELKAMWEDPEVNLTRLKQHFSPIEFHFSPPHSPHWNGLIERMVQSVKKILTSTLPTIRLTDQAMVMYFHRAAAYLNNRPIGYRRTDLSPDELEPLTPNHFLGSGIHGDLAPITWKNCNQYTGKFQELERILDSFWSRLVSESATAIREYNKWYRQYGDLKEGDIVCVLDEKVRNHFPLGIITAVHPSADGHVRKVEVRTIVNGVPKVYTRPLHRVYYLCGPDDPLERELPPDVKLLGVHEEEAPPVEGDAEVPAPPAPDLNQDGAGVPVREEKDPDQDPGPKQTRSGQCYLLYQNL
jgi:hypothetical protein